MSTNFPGRYTAQTNEPFVVFLIGMRVNKLLVKAFDHVPVKGRLDNARGRMNKAEADSTPQA